MSHRADAPGPAPHAVDERGFSLMEAIVATAIATVAVIGLAYSFGAGRALIGRYELGRAALGVAQARMETFSTLPPESLVAGSQPFVYRGQTMGTESWTVTDFNDPLTVATKDLRTLTVTVRWGFGADAQDIALTRLFRRP